MGRVSIRHVLSLTVHTPFNMQPLPPVLIRARRQDTMLQAGRKKNEWDKINFLWHVALFISSKHLCSLIWLSSSVCALFATSCSQKKNLRAWAKQPLLSSSYRCAFLPISSTHNKMAEQYSVKFEVLMSTNPVERSSCVVGTLRARGVMINMIYSCTALWYKDTACLMLRNSFHRERFSQRHKHFPKQGPAPVHPKSRSRNINYEAR